MFRYLIIQILAAVLFAAISMGHAAGNPLAGNPFADKVFSAPSGTLYCSIQPDGVTVIPNGRLLTPRGSQILIEPHPYGMALSSDGRVLATVNSGVDPFSLSILHEPFSNQPALTQIPEGVHTDEGILNACFMGIAFAPHTNNRILYASGGDDGTVMIWDVQERKRLETIELNAEFRGRLWEDSYTGAMVLSPDGSRLYVVDQMNFRVVSIDVENRAIVDVIPVGRYPFGVNITPDGKKLYVANIGLFEYSVIEGFDPNRFDETTLSFAPFPYLSDEMIHGATVDGLFAPGLGDPNDPKAVSVYAIDLSEKDQGQIAARIKTGVLVGEKVEGIPALGGSSPNAIVCGSKYVYVSNGTNDSITVISVEKDEIVNEIRLILPEPLDRLRGVIPFGLALSPDGSRLYVAESGINAVGVIDAKSHKILGHIPVGWFPSKVALSPDGQYLAVANAKGFGAGPNGGPGVDLGGRRGIGNLMRGTVSIFEIPPGSNLPSETAQVINNNVHIGFSRPWDSDEKNPIPPYPSAYESPIKYLVFIAKENRTYDQVYGELENSRGEPTLTDFGLDETVRSSTREGDIVEHVNVMPNHQILARRFACSDNFYCDSDHSADGHRWLQGVYPGVFCETSTTASYGGKRTAKVFTTAPGRRAVTGSNAALIPEDYIESGSLWDHYDRHGVSFFNFGLGFEFPLNAEKGGDAYKFTGVRFPINYPIPAPLFDRTSLRFATYNTNIPDQFRVDMFEKDFEERWLSGKEPFPRVITMSLPNDHGAGERPDDGYPYRESYMADNDLALGRVIERLSHTPYWKEMAIFITEDDAQNGRDHVDHHRSICLVVSPYARFGHVSHVHVSIPSILKTINLVLGIPYINQYDAMASDLSDLFQATPDFSPYQAVDVNRKIFDPQKALDPYDEEFNWKSLNDFPVMDSPELMRQWMKEDAERRRQGRHQ
ncbi:MAG: beta-propeller fold lactonase family protein [Candidatus Omnitrophica bacterium]|nr:beta-propeller fold lactonase family protein [Candidatus Omnitrophota bacterium]